MHRHRKEAGLFASSARFAEDFDREVTRVFVCFHPDPRDDSDRRERLVQQLERWMDAAPYPRLVRDVLLVRRAPEGGFSAEVLRPGARGFEAVSSPADLEPLRRYLGQDLHPAQGTPVAAEVPALVISLPIPRLIDEPAAEAPPGELVVVRLDARAITGEILPALTRHYFGKPQEREYAVSVVAVDDPGRVIFQSDPVSRARLRSGGDARMPMFGLRPFEELRSIWLDRGIGGSRRQLHGHEPHVSGAMPRDPRGRGGAWELVVMRRNGSLERAVARFRHHTWRSAGAS